MREIKTWREMWAKDIKQHALSQLSFADLEIAELRAALAKAQRDTVLMDWLADMNNDIGQVLLPTTSVRRNPISMRDAIEDAMREGGDS